MKTIYAIPGEPISLGREGENNARQIVFDLRPWNDLYGPGVAQLIAQRSGETTPYPVAITTDGNDAIWTVTDADTAIPGANGKAELRYYVGETLAKSAIWMTIVMDALGEPSEEPPEPYQGWLDQILAAGSDAEEERIKADASAAAAVLSERSAKESADKAVTAASNGPMIQNGTWWVWATDAEKYVDTGVAATGPAFTYEDFTAEQLAALTGPRGDTGNGIKSIVRTAGTGAAGTTDTYTITYTDGTTSTYAVYNGKDGVDGYTPQKGVDYFDGTSVTVQSVSESTEDGGNNVVTFSDGTELNVKNGSKGADGEPGKTPVKGTDYWTDEDKQELVEDVLQQTGDPSYSVLFTEQTLTNAQKNQARKNIGAMGNEISSHHSEVQYHFSENYTIQVTNVQRCGKICLFCLQIVVKTQITSDYSFTLATMPFASTMRIWINNGTQFFIDADENQIRVNNSIVPTGSHKLSGFYFIAE